MRRKISNAILLILFIAAILPLGNCKNFGSPDYTLTIDVQQGVVGTPESSVTTYNEFDQIKFEYEAEDENTRIEVLANGTKFPLSGTVTMFTDTNLVVRVIDLRDEWIFELVDVNDNETELRIVFEGADVFGGTFYDNNGNTGVWVVDGADLSMTYDNWLGYRLIGNIESMSGGDWTGNGNSGDWNAVRVEEE